MSSRLEVTLYITISTLIITVLATSIRKFTVTSLARVSPTLARLMDTRITFIGVIHHELSHALLAFITGAKIVGMKLFKVDKKTGTLGNVTFVTRGPVPIQFLQKSLAGIAPIICGSVTLYMIYTKVFNVYDLKSVEILLGVILAMQISYHMSLSKADIKTAIWGIPLLIVAIYIIVGYVNIDTKIIVDYTKIVLGIMGINLVVALILKIFK